MSDEERKKWRDNVIRIQRKRETERDIKMEIKRDGERERGE